MTRPPPYALISTLYPCSCSCLCLCRCCCSRRCLCSCFSGCHSERSEEPASRARTGSRVLPLWRATRLCSFPSRISPFSLFLPLTACTPPRSSHIVIGAKDFTEQVILGELLAQEIEASGGGPVERRFWLAGSYLCQQALISNRIDAYVEYTGTALTAILKQPLPAAIPRR